MFPAAVEAVGWMGDQEKIVMGIAGLVIAAGEQGVVLTSELALSANRLPLEQMWMMKPYLETLGSSW